MKERAAKSLGGPSDFMANPPLPRFPARHSGESVYVNQIYDMYQSPSRLPCGWVALLWFTLKSLRRPPSSAELPQARVLQRRGATSGALWSFKTLIPPLTGVLDRSTVRDWLVVSRCSSARRFASCLSQLS